MSLHFSANQFEDAYAPQRLSNWQVPKNFPERPRLRHGATRTIADDGGHFTAHHHQSSPGRKNNNLHLRFQSAPVPKSNGLFISGSAVATAKPARAAKVNLGQRTTQPTEPITGGRNNNKLQNQSDGNGNGHQQPGEGDEELDEEQEEEEGSVLEANGKGFHLMTSSSLPDNPRKAAMILAARQKNHRPLPDLMLESRDVLIPRGWNQPGASAVTVETTKAKGPTSCTKRTVVLLQPEGVEPTARAALERRPNVMELAIKWDVSSPPPSAGTSRKKIAKPAMGARQAEKTLEWLYDPPVDYRAIPVKRPEIKKSSPPAPPPPAPDSGAGSSRHGSTSSEGGRPCPLDNQRHHHSEDPESGYNSPRSADGEHQLNKTAGLTDLDEPVKATPFRSTASSAASIPPKNHFLVSTSGYGRKNSNTSNETLVLPEYPLQRRSPSLYEARDKPLPVETTNNKTLLQQQHQNQHQHQTHQQHKQQSNQYAVVSEYPPQDYRGGQSDGRHHHHHHHQCDRSDSGIGDLHDRAEEEEEYEDQEDEDDGQQRHRTNQYRDRRAGGRKQQRSRACLACHSSAPVSESQNNKSRGPANHQRTEKNKPMYKMAMKAGMPSNKNHMDLEKVIQRRQSYRAPKPFPLSSHARHIRGTLAPPLSAGNGIEPMVDYPDFKRLDSTYRLSYGVHPHPQRRRPKTLTALLNEKSSRQWKS